MCLEMGCLCAARKGGALAASRGEGVLASTMVIVLVILAVCVMLRSDVANGIPGPDSEDGEPEVTVARSALAAGGSGVGGGAVGEAVKGYPRW